jgi:hypothetical protein
MSVRKRRVIMGGRVSGWVSCYTIVFHLLNSMQTGTFPNTSPASLSHSTRQEALKSLSFLTTLRVTSQNPGPLPSPSLEASTSPSPIFPPSPAQRQWPSMWAWTCISCSRRFQRVRAVWVSYRERIGGLRCFRWSIVVGRAWGGEI